MLANYAGITRDATLRKMTPEQKLSIAFDLSEFSRNLFKQGLKERFPDLNNEEFHKRYLERIARCYNNNEKNQFEELFFSGMRFLQNNFS